MVAKVRSVSMMSGSGPRQGENVFGERTSVASTVEQVAGGGALLL